MGAAPAGAEAFDCHVSGGEDDVDGVPLAALRCQPYDVLTCEGLAKGVGVVGELGAEGDGEGGVRRFLGIGEAVVLVDVLPPRGDGGLVGDLGGSQGGDEVGDDSALGGLEFAVPDEVDGDFAREEGALVVLEELIRRFGKNPR